MTDDIYVLKATLRDIRPPIWRRLRVPGDCSLGQLHDVLQHAFGWTDSHLHEFRIGRQTFGVPSADDFGPHPIHEKKVGLDQVARPKSKLVYAYDFGDGWEHDIVVERVEQAAPSDSLPACTDGRRACPPEDCGGPLGYENLVAALSDKKHPEHAELTEWVGPYWTPEAFDIDFANRELRALGARWKRATTPRRPRARATPRPAND